MDSANLKSQRDKLTIAGIDLDAWFASTSEIIKNILGSKNSIWYNFNKLHHDYQNRLIDGWAVEVNDTYREKAMKYLTEIIDYVENMDQNQSNNQKPSDTKKSKLFQKRNQNFIIKRPLFLTVISIILVLIGAAFGLGFHFGNYQFDKEKEEYYRKMNEYKEEVMQQDSIIKKLNKKIQN